MEVVLTMAFHLPSISTHPPLFAPPPPQHYSQLRLFTLKLLSLPHLWIMLLHTVICNFLVLQYPLHLQPLKLQTSYLGWHSHLPNDFASNLCSMFPSFIFMSTLTTTSALTTTSTSTSPITSAAPCFAIETPPKIWRQLTNDTMNVMAANVCSVLKHTLLKSLLLMI